MNGLPQCLVRCLLQAAAGAVWPVQYGSRDRALRSRRRRRQAAERLPLLAALFEQAETQTASGYRREAGRPLIRALLERYVD
jgi:hypothetical protein